MPEYKSFPAFTKQVEGRTVTGFAAVTGNLDDGNDRIWKGAFKKTILEHAERVRHLWQHNDRQPPVATIKELREVGKGELPPEVKQEYPDATGGLLVAREYLDTPRGNEVLAGLTSDPPAIKEMSFAYDPVKFDFEEGDTDGMLIRNLRELRLWDTSDVNWGMNAATVASKYGRPVGEADVLAALEWLKARAADADDLKQTMTALRRALRLPEGEGKRAATAEELERVKGALDTLQEVLWAAEPPDDDGQALTAELLFGQYQRTLAKLHGVQV